MNNPFSRRRPGRELNRGGLLPLSLAVAVCSVSAKPALALVITSEVGVNTAVEFNNLNNVVREDDADTTSGGPANARVQLGDGRNAFNQETFAQAFSAFRNDQATYWVNLNADNTRSPGDGGIGAAGVQLTYTAIKEHGDRAFTLHTTGGKLRLIDPEAGSTPLSAFVDLDAFVLHGTDVLTHVSANASLFGNGGSTLLQTFRLRSEGFDIQTGDFTLQDDFPGNNIVGATLELRPLDIPVNLANIVDGTPITINVTLNGEVRAPGGETGALAFFRDPTHIDDPDPFAGSPSIIFDNPSTGPGTGVPEPSSLVLVGPGLLAAWVCVRRRRSRAG